MPGTAHVVGATSKIIPIRALVPSTNLPYTAGVFNTATISASYCKDGSTPTAITLVTMTQGTWVSGGFVHRHKGVYELGAPNAAFSTTVDGVVFAIDGIADVLWEVVRVELTGVDPRSATVPDVNVTKVGGTTQTARDIGLSVLLSSGTGTGQLNITSGVVQADAAKVGGQTATAAAGVTFPSSIASPTNITAGTITTVTNLTNSATAGDFTATQKASITTAVPTAAGVAAAVQTSATATPLAADVKKINAVTITGAGVLANEFQP